MYELRFTATALEQLQKLDKPVARQVLKKLQWLAEHFDESVQSPLTGNLKDIYKLRIGDYRALYTSTKKNKRSLFNIEARYIRQNRSTSGV